MKPFIPPPILNIDLDATRLEKASRVRVVEALERFLAGLDPAAAAAIGPLSVSTSTHQDHWDHWHQIRSEPLPGFGGAEFRFDVPRGEVLPKNPIFDGLAASIPRFLASREEIAGRVETIRVAAGGALCGPMGAWCPPEPLAIGIAYHADSETPRAVVEVRTLGHGLHPVVERVQARSVAALTVKLEALAGRHLRRARLRAAFAADGVAGRVEGTTRRILATVGKEPDWAIPLLEERGTVDIWFAPEPGSIHARIRWCEGVLKTDFSNPAFRCDLIGDEHTVFRLLPAKTLAARIGRPLGTLTKDQFIPPETIVFDARREDNGWTRLTLAIPRTPIPIGRPRGRPDGR